MARHQRVTTYKSKQVAFDKTLIPDLTEGEPDYYLVCLDPTQRWLLLTLLEFYTTFRGRFKGGWTDREIDQLHATLLKELIKPMACQEDIQAINTTLQSISLTLIEMRDLIGPPGSSVNSRLVEVVTELGDIETAVDDAFPDPIFDQVEAVLNGMGVILGAPVIPIAP